MLSFAIAYDKLRSYTPTAFPHFGTPVLVTTVDPISVLWRSETGGRQPTVAYGIGFKLDDNLHLRNLLDLSDDGVDIISVLGFSAIGNNIFSSGGTGGAVTRRRTSTK